MGDLKPLKKENILQVLKKELAELEEKRGVLKETLKNKQAELNKKQNKFVDFKKEMTKRLRLLDKEKEKYQQAIKAVGKIHNGKN